MSRNRRARRSEHRLGEAAAGQETLSERNAGTNVHPLGKRPGGHLRIVAHLPPLPWPRHRADRY